MIESLRLPNQRSQLLGVEGVVLQRRGRQPLGASLRIWLARHGNSAIWNGPQAWLRSVGQTAEEDKADHMIANEISIADDVVVDKPEPMDLDIDPDLLKALTANRFF